MSKSNQVREVLESGEPFRIAGVAREVGCTPALVSQIKTVMRSEGEDFEERVLPGRGMPAVFRLRSGEETREVAETQRRRAEQRERAGIRRGLASALDVAVKQVTSLEDLIRRLDALGP